MRDTELAWLAGFIDGEGTFSLSGANDRTSVHPVVQVVNTHLPTMTVVHRMFSEFGTPTLKHVTYANGKYSERGWSDLYRVTLRRLVDISNCCRALLPYLVLKREKAELMLAFCDLRLESIMAANGWVGLPYSDEERLLVSLLRGT